MHTSESIPGDEANLPVAVDATGGDSGTFFQVEGAVQAYKEFGCRSLLVGPQEELSGHLESLGGTKLPISIVHAPDTITMEDSPTRAVLRKPDSSLCTAYNLVESAAASSIISAGNSGALMAAGIMICGLMPGIKRPAIATLMPVAGDKRPNVILDSGANVDCDAHNLLQFAVMGAIYYSTLFQVERPGVALLSNGTEESKGTDVIRSAALLLQDLAWINYIGYVEGRDVANKVAEVIVCDGLVGNVLLKSMQGCVKLVFEQLMHEGRKGLLRRLGLALTRGVYEEVFTKRFDYTAHGGAPLLGLRKLALVLHGSSDARAVKNAIRVADNFAKKGMNEKISLELAKLEEDELGPIDGFFANMIEERGVSTGKDKNEAPKKVKGKKAAAVDSGGEKTPKK